MEKTGSVAPGQMGGHKPKAIRGEHHDWLIRWCQEKDFTLRGLVEELAEHGLKVDYRSVWEFGHAQKLSIKKPCFPANRIGPTSHESAGRGRRIRAGS